MYIGIIWADWGKVRHAVSKPRERQRVRETELRKGRERENNGFMESDWTARV